MSRRKIVAIVSAAVLLALCVLAVGLVVGVTQTGTGQGYIRDLVVGRVAPRVRGKLYVGRISGSFLEGVTIDSVELRGIDDSLVAASGRIRVVYDLRDLFDKRVLLKRVDVTNPVVRFEQAEDGTWNYKKAFAASKPSTTPRTRGFGDYVVAESVTVRGASFILTQPWHPADSLRGARLDSAAAYNVGRRDAEIRRRGGDFTRTWRWTGATIDLAGGLLAVP
jgi:translocation and assembly module TamB